MSHDELHERGAHDRQRHLVEVAGDALIAQEEAWVGHAGHGGQSLDRLAVSATNHCLTGCVIGEVTGALSAIASIALAADTVSIAIMEVIDNAFMLLVPGAMEAGLGDLRYWLPLLGGFAIAWPFAFAVNRAMIGRGKGHAVMHEYHH
jgi:Domain of unknown function (DUF4396)